MSFNKLLVPVEEQAARFVRLFVIVFVPQVIAMGHPTRDAVWALVVSSAETAWKELHAQAKKKLHAKNAVVDSSGDPDVGTDLGEDNPPDPNA